jgi:hypothetical protein
MAAKKVSAKAEKSTSGTKFVNGKAVKAEKAVKAPKAVKAVKTEVAPKAVKAVKVEKGEKKISRTGFIIRGLLDQNKTDKEIFDATNKLYGTCETVAGKLSYVSTVRWNINHGIDGKRIVAELGIQLPIEKVGE